jgi:hypothetical protein
MVRAVGLYPAGSRFESWLPYHLTSLPRLAVERLEERADLVDDDAPALLRQGA